MPFLFAEICWLKSTWEYCLPVDQFASRRVTKRLIREQCEPKYSEVKGCPGRALFRPYDTVAIFKIYNASAADSSR